MRLNEDEKLMALIANQKLNYPIQDIDENKLPLEFINTNKLSLILEKQGIKIPTAEKEREKINILINELSEIKCVFNRYNVNFVVIKSFEKLPKPLSDVDILVSDMRMAESALRQIGYTQETEDEPYKKLYIRKIGDERVAMHLHSEIAWRGIKYLERNEVFDKSTKREINGIDIPVPCPEHEILITAAHMLFERGNNKITLYDVLNVASIFKEHDVNMKSIEADAKRNGWQKQFLFFIHSVGIIYEELYQESLPFLNSRSGRKIGNLPFLFPIHSVISLRAQKIFTTLRSFGIRRALRELYAYSLDVLDIFKERYGITSLKRRLGK